MYRRSHYLFATLSLCLAMLPDRLQANNNDLGLAAGLANCSEPIGFGPIPLVTPQALVSPRFSVANLQPGAAGLVVRTSACQKFTLDRPQPGPVLVAQIGIAIVSPDRTGDINNYSLLYVTNSNRLAEALQEAGLPAQVDRTLAYELRSHLSYGRQGPFGDPFQLRSIK